MLRAYHAFVSTYDDALRAVNRLRQDPNVRYAEIQPPLFHPVKFSKRRPTPASVYDLFPFSGTPNLQAEQGYLLPAPSGVDAIFAWNQPSGRGAGIKIIDIESGWNFQHEDLLQQTGGVVYGPVEDDDHGTAVLGIFSSDDNAFGVKGIACDAHVYAASAVWDGLGKK